MQIFVNLTEFWQSLIMNLMNLINEIQYYMRWKSIFGLREWTVLFFLCLFGPIHPNPLYHLFQIDLVQKRRKIKKFDDGIDHNVHVIGGRWESENEF